MENGFLHYLHGHGTLAVTNHCSPQEKEAIVKLDLATRDLRCLRIPTGRQRHRVTRPQSV